MFMKLEIIKETDRAYQLPNGSYIPKSILDDRGLKHPYYQIKNWWLTKIIGRWRNDGCKSSVLVLNGISPLIVSFNTLPDDIKEYWNKYWGSISTEKWYDFEPRLFGNDCFDGEMSTFFD